MITVDSSIHPVYSNATGEKSKRGQRQEKRAERRSTRKAKRLKRVRLRNGKKATVYVLTKLAPAKKNFDGEFSYIDDPVSTLTQSTDFVKTNPDGTTTVIKKEDVVKSSTGAYYDKNEVAKVYGVTKETVTQPMIDRITVAVTPTGDNPTTDEQQKNANSDLAIVVDEQKIVTDALGNMVLKVDQEGGDQMSDEEKAKLAQKQAEEDKKKRMRKILIWGGVGVVVLVATVLVIRNMKK